MGIHEFLIKFEQLGKTSYAKRLPECESVRMRRLVLSAYLNFSVSFSSCRSKSLFSSLSIPSKEFCSQKSFPVIKLTWRLLRLHTILNDGVRDGAKNRMYASLNCHCTIETRQSMNSKFLQIWNEMEGNAIFLRIFQVMG